MYKIVSKKGLIGEFSLENTLKFGKVEASDRFYQSIVAKVDFNTNFHFC